MAHRIRLGVAGLGRAFTLMLPTLVAESRVQLVAAADPREEARERFRSDFAARTYTNIEDLCADRDVEAIYVATPHQHHASHVLAAAKERKHVLVEKPMALTLAECQSMVGAARAAGVHIVVGHSHSFDAPFRRARQIIESGMLGRPRMITALNYTDFLYRPRRPEELVTEAGGGVVYSQGAHQIDIVRLLGGGLLHSVRATTGAWDRARPAEGAYAAHLTFGDGTFASAIYSGYAYFDSDEFCGWIGEMGQRKDPANYGRARKRLLQVQAPDQEIALKNERNYGGRGYTPPNLDSNPVGHQQFGFVLVSCEGGDLRPRPDGVMIYGDDNQRLDPLPPSSVPRREVVDELYDAVVFNRPPIHSGAWALATTEACLAILESSRTQTEVRLNHQVALPD